jgi:very-short-patch-repair endonuclease
MSTEEYPYPLFNEDGKVICQICGKPFMVISPRHLSGKHNIKYGEYKLRFPDAPFSNAEFAARSKFGKEKGIFNDDEVQVEELGDIQKEFDGLEDPEIHDEMEIDISKLTETVRKYKDPMQEKKSRILDHLRTFFSNIQQDFMIQLIDGGGKLHEEYITDFADPILKVNIEFPDTFWHNQGNVDLMRDEKMKMYGWKIIKISGAAPSLSKMTEIISQGL